MAGAAENQSPSSRQIRRHFTGRTHATADFTEADDDDEDDDFNDEGVSRFDNDADDADDHDIEDEDANGSPRALPVLPLFSATHLGMKASVA